MTTSVGTKARKKQSSLSTRRVTLEQSLLALEDTCLGILENRFARTKEDVDGLYWQQRFKNVALPVSLALQECRGPRRFHNHYRHRRNDASILHPVLENPVDQLAHVCETALDACRNDLVGIYGDDFIRARRTLEHALQIFLLRYRKIR